MKMNYKIVRFLGLFAIISSMLVLNVWGLSQDHINTEYYNPALHLSASYSPNISLFSVNSNNNITLRTSEGTAFNAFKRTGVMPQTIIDAWDDYIKQFSGVTQVEGGEPCYSYNCHSYAWYDQSTSNEYWINLPNQFIDDVHCSDELTISQVQVGDIATYWTYGDYYDNDGNPQNGYHCAHSAVIDSIEYNVVDEKYIITCKSKWGPGGLYIHNIYEVPYDCSDIKYYRYTQDEHFLFIDENNGESGHTFVCTADTKDENGNVIKSCSYTTECIGEFTVTSVNSSYHRIYCSNCYYSEYVDHDLYMYSADTEDYVVKCHDCTYTVECWESPEYYGNSNDGHWVDCACGCYSFFEPHTPGSYSGTGESYHNVVCADCGYIYSEDCNYGSSTSSSNSSYHFYECADCGYEQAESHIFIYSQIVDDNFSHNAYCRVCQATYSKPHNWVSVVGGYECSDCGKTTLILPDYSSLSDEELGLLLSSMSEEELEAFLASLPEDDLARVTAILPPDDDELVTE